MNPRRRLGSGLRLVALAFACASAAAQPAGAEVNREQQVKAAYLYNFARFTTWPASKLARPDDPIRFCVQRGDPLAAAMHEALDGKSIDEHPTQVLELTDAQAMRTCHLAYLGKRPGLQLDAELQALDNAEVVTVHEGESARTAGIVRLFIEDNRLRFEINMAAAERSHIGLSARLLGLARVVRE